MNQPTSMNPHRYPRFSSLWLQRTFAFGCASVIAFTSLSRAQQWTAAPDHADGIYEFGQSIQWRVETTNTTATNSLNYTIKQGGLTVVTNGTLELTNGAGVIEAVLNTPGTLLLLADGNGRQPRALSGAVVSPWKIQPSAPRPTDFDEFWDAKVKELEAVPANPKLEPGDAGKPGLDYWKITMDNIRGSHIQGQLARPHTGEKFPALLVVQWAGVYPLQKSWVTDRAAKGWIVLNIEAHDLPIDQPAEFYKEQSDGPLKNYWNIGNDDRDTSYYLRMYLSCYRAAQYLSERPDWDGKTLAVTGDSQGGQQTLMTAGFYPKITAAMALVPSGCDMLGPDVGRRGGWPQWYDNVNGKDAQKVHEASRYYDIVNFASRIKCPVLVGMGLIDETCPPAGVLAAVSQITSPKEVVILLKSGHQDSHGSQAPFRHRRDDAWLPALQKGNPPPVISP